MNKYCLLLFFISVLPGLPCRAQKAPSVVDTGPVPFFDSTRMRKAVDDAPYPTLFNVFLLQRSLRLREKDYAGFTDTSLQNNIKKLNANTYRIDVNDLSENIILVNSFEAGYSFKVTNDQDPNSAAISWRPYDAAKFNDNRSLSFDPYFTSYGLFDNRNKKMLVQFLFNYVFPEPIPILMTTDSALIAKKKKNAGYHFSQIVPADKTPPYTSFTTDRNEVLILFEHFLRNARSGKLDKLEYKINDGNWVSTALSYTPSILLENLQPGKYLLYVKYSAEKAKPLKIELEIQPLKHSTLWWVLGSGALSAILFYLIYKIRLNAVKQKANKIRLELQSIQSQLNPHFMFNALASIQYLMNKNENQKANHYLTEFSTLLRNSLYNSEQELVPLSQELQTLETYIKLEQLRFNFRYTIKTDESVVAENLMTPSLLLQPLVENAIKHGISSLREHGSLQIFVSQENRNLEIAIRDNGSGFNTKQYHGGLGIRLVKERIAVLKKQDFHIGFSIFSNQTDTTVATLTFKHWL